MRIVSTLPTATEIVYQLGLGRQLVGVSHECNYPREASKKARVSETDIDYGKATSREIDDHVSEKMHQHHSLYKLNESLVTSLKPTHLITQKLCDVCAITPSDVQAVFRKLPQKPDLITLNPTSLEDILQDIVKVGKSLDRKTEAESLVQKLRSKIKNIRLRSYNLDLKSVFCLEWIDPPFACGHWVPEMVGIAGGKEVLGKAGKPSRKINWEEVAVADPEIIVAMPCGFSFEKNLEEMKLLEGNSIWRNLRAVRNDQVYLVDGPSYFNQSGPRVIEKGLEILAKITHPQIFGLPNQKEALQLVHSPLPRV